VSVTTSVIACLLGIPGLYLLLVAWTAVRLTQFAKRLRREAAPHGWELEARLFVLFPADLWDPITLEVGLRRNGRRCTFSVFRSLIEHWQPVHVRVSSSSLSEHLEGRFYVDRKERGRVVDRLLADRRVHEVATEEGELPPGWRLCASDADATRVRRALRRREVHARLGAYDGDLLAIDTAGFTVNRRRDAELYTFLAQVARLADALDDAAENTAPYRS